MHASGRWKHCYMNDALAVVSAAVCVSASAAGLIAAFLLDHLLDNPFVLFLFFSDFTWAYLLYLLTSFKVLNVWPARS